MIWELFVDTCLTNSAEASIAWLRLLYLRFYAPLPAAPGGVAARDPAGQTTAELYMALAVKSVKRKSWKYLRYVTTADEQFIKRPAFAGMVMLVFTLPVV